MLTRYTPLTAFEVLNDAGHEQANRTQPTERRPEVKRQQLGVNQGRETDFDDVPMSSVVYMGRGSFRMEAVALDPGQELGVVQPIENTRGIVTAPLHTPPPERLQTAERRGHDPRALFSSQVDVPVLAAPSGTVSLHTPAVTLTRAMLVTLCGLVLLCGVVVGTAARHLLASPAPLAVVAAPPAAPPVAAAPVVIPAVQAVAAVEAPSMVTPPSALASAPAVAVPAPAPVVTLPPPLAIHARAKVVAAPKAPSAPVSPVARKAPKTQDTPTVSKPWVDPWAE
jgi:hypothetical protein